MIQFKYRHLPQASLSYEQVREHARQYLGHFREKYPNSRVGALDFEIASMMMAGFAQVELDIEEELNTCKTPVVQGRRFRDE